MNLWGIVMWAAFGVLCYLLGRLHGPVKPKRNSWDIVVTPRVMEPVEQPEDTRPQWEIDMDETANRAWRNAW